MSPPEAVPMGHGVENQVLTMLFFPYVFKYHGQINFMYFMAARNIFLLERRKISGCLLAATEG